MAVRGGRIYCAFDFAANAGCWKVDITLSSEIAACGMKLHHGEFDFDKDFAATIIIPDEAASRTAGLCYFSRSMDPANNAGSQAAGLSRKESKGKITLEVGEDAEDLPAP